jgi:hypothetical protein
MYIACEGGEVLDVLHVFIILEDALIQMADTPAEGDVVVEELGELGSGLTGIGITPSAEGYEDLLLLVESHIAVHHSGETNGGEGLDFTVVLLLDVLAEVGIAVLKTVPNGLGRVGPETVYQLIFPLV